MSSLTFRPLPSPSSLTEPFWKAAAEHRLVAQCCDACGRLRHYPRPMCPVCHAMQLSGTCHRDFLLRPEIEIDIQLMINV